jgi:endonuclease/exonuclease/phosphatase family metal-dependent hydrolase
VESHDSFFSDSSLKLGCLNIEKYRHIERVIPALCESDLDVVCMQEVPKDMVGRIADALHASAYFLPLWRVWREEFKEERIFGLAVFVRNGTATQYDDFFYHIASPTDQPWPQNRILQYITVEKDGVPYHIGNTHFTWTPDALPSIEQYRDINALLSVFDTHIPNNDLILCGDFNAPRGGPIWGKLSERLRDSIPPFVITTIDQEYHRAAPLYLVVDGMFASAHYTVSDVEVTGGMSDHMLIAGKVVRVLC